MSESNGLPERVDPYRLAAVNGIVQGKVALTGMPRLADYLLAEDVPKDRCAQVIMRFSHDSERRVVIHGELTVRLTLQCQRCMLGLDWPVAAQLKLVVVADEEAGAQVPREYDPVVADAQGLSPAVIVEDELILAMPTVARCQNANCPRAPQALTAGNRSKNPFAALRDINFGDDTT